MDQQVEIWGRALRVLAGAGVTALTVALSLPAHAGSPSAAPENAYSFDRWSVAASALQSGASQSGLAQSGSSQFNGAKVTPSTGFADYDDLVVHGLGQSQPKGAPLAGASLTGASLMGAHIPAGQETLTGLGFFGGVDTTTALFYTAGAAFGVIGANLESDPDAENVYGGTSFLEDPANFVTDEFQNQYGLGRIKAQYAYARGHTGSGVLVSVMDTPFNTGHTNLDGAFVAGYDPATGDANVDLNCQSPSNPCQHGTHVAGIIGARKTDSGSSMHGVAYDVKIKPVAFLNDAITLAQQQVDAFAEASGVDDETDQQIVAMNNSWGPIAGFHSQTYNDKYFKVPETADVASNSSVYLGSRSAAEADTIMVFAAGNDGWNSETGQIYLYDSPTASAPSAVASASDIVADADISLDSANRVDTTTAMPVHAPDTAPYIIDADENEYMWLVVVATDENDTITSFSNGCGDAMNFCLAAPGDDIKSTNGLNSTPYVDLPGTSMAAPHVTGAIALLAEMYPNLLDKPENISQILLETATDLGAVGIDPVYGHGLLNLQDATGPLGSINIADSHFGSSSSTYGGGATIETPVAFGDALDGGVMIGAVDKYDRVFMLDLPVSKTEMTGQNLGAKFSQSLTKTPPKKDIGGGLSFEAVANEEDTGLAQAGLHYAGHTPRGAMTASVMMNMQPEQPMAGLDGPSGYARYFDAMAYGTKTNQRLSLSMTNSGDALTQLGADIRIDRDKDNQITMLSQSHMKKRFGPITATFAFGGITEQGRFLGGDMTGALAVHNSHTIFAKTGFALPITPRLSLDGFYEMGRSQLDFIHDHLASADGIWTDTYGLSLSARPDDQSQFFVALRRPVAITDGQLNINTVTGYTQDGDYRGDTLAYGLVPRHRETELLAEYRKQFFPGNVIAFGLQHQHNAYNRAGVENSGGYLRGEWIF